MRRVILSLLLAAPPTLAQLADPRLGCFTYQEANYEILGVPANWIVRATGACAPVESSWRIVPAMSAEESEAAKDEDEDNAAPWLERRDAASDAVEVRRRLGPGTWAVFADGTTVQLDALHLPGALRSWSLVAPQWMLVRTDEALVLLRADGEWFYLPIPDTAASKPTTHEGAPAQ